MRIRKMRQEDWGSVQVIYLEGISTGAATFEGDCSGWEHWNASHRSDCRLVGKVGDQIVGWCALKPVSDRRVYSGVAELSIYLAANYQGRGLGKTLMKALIRESERTGIWTLQAGMFPENSASIALHKACGFREVGYRRRMGRLRGEWKDVVLMERRSRVVGL